jgi:hypothetical protein
MHMIQNACNLRYKDAYTSCYICHAKCKKCTKESYTYATKELPHTQLKKSNTHQAPPTNKWKLLDLGVWWKYRQVGHVLSFGMEHWILCNAYGTSAITLKWDMGILLTKVIHGVCDPKGLRATTSCGNVLASVVDWATLDCLRED